YFEMIMKEFGDKALLNLAMHENQPIAFHLNICFKTVMICQFAGSLEDYYKFYPNEFLFWSEIQQACILGLKEFDLCCSGINSGSAEYKRQMRLHEEPMDNQYAFADGHNPFLQSSKAERSDKGRLKQVWQRLPKPVTNALGPRV